MACGVNYEPKYFAKNNITRKWLIDRLQEIFNSKIDNEPNKSLLRWRMIVGASAFNLDYCGKVALQCYGSGYDGKSTIEKLYRGVFDGNRQKNDIESYFAVLNSRFWVYEETSNHDSNIIHLNKKRVVWSTDVPSNAREIKTGNLKRIIDTTDQVVRAAHASTSEIASIHPCMQLDSNVIMHLENSDPGSTRRIMPYKMPVRYIVNKKDPAWDNDLHKSGKMQIADPAVARRFQTDKKLHECFLCLQLEYGYNDLYKKYNGDVYAIPKPSIVSDTITEFINRTDIIINWLNYNLIKKETSEICASEVCKAFINYIKKYDTALINKYASLNDVFESIKQTVYQNSLKNIENIEQCTIKGYMLKPSE